METKCASACCQKRKQQRPEREFHKRGNGELGLYYRPFSKHIPPQILCRNQLQTDAKQFSYFLLTQQYASFNKGQTSGHVGILLYPLLNGQKVSLGLSEYVFFKISPRDKMFNI